MVRVLFVCLGNICRSPAAEGVMKDLADQKGLAETLIIDSAGTSGFHTGQLPDSRMRDAAGARGIALDSYAREFKADFDFDSFDYIIAMDRSNFHHIKYMDAQGLHGPKIFLLSEFKRERSENEVPDPYYGGPESFERVLDIVTDACEGLLQEIIKNHGL